MTSGSIAVSMNGEIYGKLTVVSDGPKATHGGRRVYCRCSCGTESFLVERHQLRRGKSTHCGCSDPRIIHGQSRRRQKTKIYGVWATLLYRCGDPKNPTYANIEVCERWYDFLNFLADMGEPPFLGASLDRIDNSKGYFPGNVRWATTYEQNRNKKSNVFVEWQGVSQCLADWGKHIGVDRSVMSRRYSLWGACEKTFTPGPIPRFRDSLGHFK